MKFGVIWARLPWFLLVVAVAVASLWLWQFILLPYNPAQGLRDYQAQQVQQLQIMKEQGLLTEEEFSAKKRQILGI